MADRTYVAVAVCFLGYEWAVEVSSIDRARWIEYRWEQYRRLWWVFALVAACIVVREFLPIPPVFARTTNDSVTRRPVASLGRHGPRRAWRSGAAPGGRGP